MAEAARVVEQMGANIVDVNMGCPVPKIAKHNAGCSLMREPAHAAEIIAAMSKAVKIPVTVKMRKGWDDGEVNAGELAKRVEDAGAKAIAIHGRTAKQSYSGFGRLGFRLRDREDGVDSGVWIRRLHRARRHHRADESGVSGVYVGRGVLRNPWILAQARDLMEGRPARTITRRRARPVPARLHAAAADEVEEAKVSACSAQPRPRPQANERRSAASAG